MTRPEVSVATRVIARTGAEERIRRAEASSGVGGRAHAVSRTVARAVLRTAKRVAVFRQGELSFWTAAGARSGGV